MCIRDSPHPGDARADESGRRPTGGDREPGGRCARQIRGEAGGAMSSTGQKFEMSTIEEALEDLASGKMVVVGDDEDRENEGDLVMAAQFVAPDDIKFM